MSVSLLIDLCGLPLLIVLSTTSLLLTIIAFYLSFSAKQEKLLTAFVPLTVIPVIAGLGTTFSAMLSSVATGLDSEADLGIDSGFLMQMNLIPLLAGMIASVPPAILASIGRWRLAWQESGIELIKKKDDVSKSIKPDAWLAQETEDYLEKLTRPR